MQKKVAKVASYTTIGVGGSNTAAKLCETNNFQAMLILLLLTFKTL